MSFKHACRQCGKPLAVADQVCAACGHAVPAADRLRLLLERAEGMASAGAYAEAARTLEGALQQDLDPGTAKLLWRKRGGWLVRAGRPELLDAAEAALAEALRIDDSDDLSHQVWMDLLGRRGHLDKARAWYEERLRLEPGDAMASRQLQILKLRADFQAAPLPKLDLPQADPKGMMAGLFRPSPLKNGLAGLGLLVNGVLLARALLAPGPVVRGDGISGVEEMGAFLKLLNDPWLPGVPAAFCAAYLAWAWWMRRG